MTIHFYFLAALAAFAPAALADTDACNSYDLDFAPTKNLDVVYQWGYLDFEYPDLKSRDKAFQNGSFVPKNVTALEVNEYKGRIFLTLPRIKYGVPATLVTLSDKKHRGQPLLKPYPNWESNRLENPEGLTSVYTTYIDRERGILYVLDSGVVDVAYRQPTRVSQPKIVVYDLNNKDKLIGVYHIPDKVLDCNSVLTDFRVDIRNTHKDDVYIYIADSYASKLIVFDLHHKSFHRSFQSSFIADPKYVDVNIFGKRVFYNTGLVSLSLGPICNGDRRVYYHAYASVEECYVMASTLRDKTYETNEIAFPDAYYCLDKKRESLSSIEYTTKEGIVYYFQEQLAAIFCWNTIIDPNALHTSIIAQNETTQQGIGVLKVIGKNIWGVSTRLQYFLDGDLTGRNVNIRLLRGNVEDLTRGTSCDPKACIHKPHYKEVEFDTDY